MKKILLCISAFLCIAFANAAPDTSWVNGLAASSSAGADAQNPWDPQSPADQEKLFGQPTSQDASNLEAAVNSSRNEEGLKRAGEENAKKLAQGQGSDAAQDGYSIFEQSIVSPTGQVTTQSYGCGFRRTQPSDLVYKPSAPAGQRIQNHTIEPDDPSGCTAQFEGPFGASCELQTSNVSCQVADNNRIVYGEMSAYNVRTEQYEDMPANQVATLPSCGNLELYDDKANLVTNGGFESPALGWGQWSYFHGSIQGWTGSLIEIQNNHKGRLAAEGNQYAELNSEGWGPTISQTLNTTPGVTYSVSFLHRPHSYNSEKTRVQIGAVDVNLSGGNKHSWNRVSVPFTATDAQTTLTLSPANPINSKFGNLVDDVRVSADYCKRVPEIKVTPDVSKQELGPLWANDNQNDVCWVGGMDAECTINTGTADQSIEQMARQIGQQDGVDQKYLELFGQCTTTNVTNTHNEDLGYTTSKYCTTDVEPKFDACTVQRNARLQPGTIRLASDSWAGSNRCTQLVNEYPSWESTCSANVATTGSGCIDVDGVEVCSCSTIQSNYGESLSACNAGQTVVTNSLASAVPGIATQAVGMCVDIQNQITPPSPTPPDFEPCPTGFSQFNHNGNDVCVSKSPAKPKATCGPYNDLQNSSLAYGVSSGMLTSTVSIGEVSCPTLDSEECTASGECYNPALYPYDCSALEADSSCSVTQTRCDQEFDHPLGTYCGIAEQEFSCDVGATIQEEYTKEVTDCGDQGMFECVDDTCFDYQPERDGGFAEATARLAIVNSMVDDMFCSDPDDMTTCEIFSGKERHCSYGNGLGSLLYGCCPGHEALLNPFSALYNAAEIMTKSLDMIVDRIPPSLTNSTGFAIAGPGTYMSMVASKEQTKAYVDISQSILDNVPNWLVNQCNDSAALIMSHAENEPNIELMHYGGRYCSRKISYGFGKICVAKRMNYCVYNTAFAKIVMDAAAGQFGINRTKYNKNTPMDCRGITIAELQQLDWSRVDTKKLAGMMANTGNMPPDLSHQFGVGNVSPPTTDPTDMPAGWQ